MDCPLKILILKDEGDGDLIEYELSKSPLSLTAMWVSSCDAFLHALKEFCPNLILADPNFSKFDSLLALALAQEEYPEVPFIFLSADMSMF